MRGFLPSVCLLVLTASSSAFADGVFIWNKGVDLYGPNQNAAILYDDGIEDLVLQVRYEGEAKDFAWLVPLPSRPEVHAVDADVFAELSLHTQKRERWFAWEGFARAGETPAGEVIVLERKKVGVYDVAVFKADTSDALMTWLKDNDYAIPEKARGVVGEYAKKGWVFAALRIDPGDKRVWAEKSLDRGTLRPIKFTFKCKKAVYPLKISSLNKGSTEVLLYVFAKDVMVHPDFAVHAPDVGEFYYRSLPRGSRTEETARDNFFAESFDLDHRFYRPVRKGELPLCESVLTRLQDKPYYLCKLRAVLKPEEMQEDLALKPPEELSLPEQYQFVRRQGGFHNSLLLRTRQQACRYFTDELKKMGGNKQDRDFCTRGFAFLAVDPSQDDLQIMRWAASHPSGWVREALGDSFGYQMRFSKGSRPPSWAGELVPILRVLMHGMLAHRKYTDSVDPVARCLAAIGSNEALDVLAGAVRDDRGVTGPDGTGYPTRRKALDVLSEVKNPRLVDVYRDAIRKGDLIQDEVFLCLRGLETIGDPKTIPLVEEILRLCVEKRYTRDIEGATRLLEKLRRGGNRTVGKD